MSHFHWKAELKFLLAAGLATLCIGLVLLAPRLERNAALEQACWEQQHELIRLEEQNAYRRAFLQRINSDADFREQFLVGGEYATPAGQLIAIPAGLALHPDGLLRSEHTTETPPLPEPPHWKAVTLAWARALNQSERARQLLLALACGCLLVGSLSWNPTTYLHWQRRTRLRFRRWGQRYWKHPEQAEFAGPHFTPKPRESGAEEEAHLASVGPQPINPRDPQGAESPVRHKPQSRG